MARGPAPQAASRTASRPLTGLVRNMAVQDWVCSGFHAYMLMRIAAAPEGSLQGFAQRFALMLLTCTLTTILLVRGEVLPAGRVRAFVYRVGMFVPMVLSYFELRTLLPALRLPLLDAQLLTIDEALFGSTPAVWLGSLSSPPVVEWFAFFYWSYFLILGAMLLPSLFFGRGQRRDEVMVGALVIATVGHIGYTLVPGVGPYAAMTFDQPLAGGFWWGAVQSTVDGAGAMMDIFPSLHTAYPMFFALHAFSHRDRLLMRFAWPVLAFFAGNIVVATLLLRWHYGIDVLAGFLLAVVASSIAKRVASQERRRHRDDADRQPVWEELTAY